MARLSEQELAAVERRYAASQELQGWYRTAPHAHLDAVQDIPRLLAAYRGTLAALEQGHRALQIACGVANAWVVSHGMPIDDATNALVIAGREAMEAALGLPTEGTPAPEKG